MSINILIEHTLAMQKLNQFRRHPDWHKAFEQVLASGLLALSDAVDQQFIDNNIRSDRVTAP
jgi:hypothetical protein